MAPRAPLASDLGTTVTDTLDKNLDLKTFFNVLLRAARLVPDDDRDAFFSAVHSCLAPLREVRATDVRHACSAVMAELRVANVPTANASRANGKRIDANHHTADVHHIDGSSVCRGYTGSGQLPVFSTFSIF